MVYYYLCPELNQKFVWEIDYLLFKPCVTWKWIAGFSTTEFEVSFIIVCTTVFQVEFIL